MKKSLTKKLFLSILSIAFAVVCLGTTTFAWFTLTTESKVEPFVFDVQGGSGFEVAVTKKGDLVSESTNWYSGSIPASAITGLFQNGEINTFEGFDALTTRRSDLFAFYKTAIDSQKQLITDTSKTIDKGYLALDFHFRLVNKDDEQQHSISVSEVKLEDVTTSNKTWIAQYDYQTAQKTGNAITTGDSVEYSVASCARIGFEGGDNKIVYEDNASLDTLNTNGKVVKVGNTRGFGSDTSGAMQYYLKSNTSVEKSLVGEDSKYSVVENNVTSKEVLKDVEFINETEEQDIKITVYVWLEGWDAECMSSVLSHKLQVSFKFSLDKQEN